MKPLKNRDYPAVDIAIKRYGATKSRRIGFVRIKGKIVDLTASGKEDWQVAMNIIKQL